MKNINLKVIEEYYSKRKNGREITSTKELIKNDDIYNAKTSRNIRINPPIIDSDRTIKKKQNIIFQKLQQKFVDDDEIECEEENTIIKTKSKKPLFHKYNKSENINKFENKTEILFPINNEMINNVIREFYYPLIKNISLQETLRKNSKIINSIFEKYIKLESIFSPVIMDNNSNSYIQLLLKQKENEEVLLNIFIFLMQNILNINFKVL